jgi:hypothetical protein
MIFAGNSTENYQKVLLQEEAGRGLLFIPDLRYSGITDSDLHYLAIVLLNSSLAGRKAGVINIC